MENDIMVSIDCTAYNHGKYIAKALDSFLMQKTDFPIEILVHDDASTDNTADIIREYEKKYPQLIKPIYRTENQYSKGAKVQVFNFTRAKGKYIAVCEGDDYWTDPNKLQVQVEYMEAHPSCSFCIHAAAVVDADSGNPVGEVRPAATNKIFSVEEVIRGGGGMCATNSMFFPAALVKEMPDFFYMSPVPDYPLNIYLAFLGETHYIDINMSAYRYLSSGSWTKRLRADKNMAIEVYLGIIRFLESANEYSCGKYDAVIKQAILRNEFDMALVNYDIKELRKDKYKDLYGNMTTAKKAAYFMDANFPALTSSLIYLKERLKSRNSSY